MEIEIARVKVEFLTSKRQRWDSQKSNGHDAYTDIIFRNVGSADVSDRLRSAVCRGLLGLRSEIVSEHVRFHFGLVLTLQPIV